MLSLFRFRFNIFCSSVEDNFLKISKWNINQDGQSQSSNDKNNKIVEVQLEKLH